MTEENTESSVDPSTEKSGLIFYTTAGCHLCEEAERLLIELVAQHPVTVEVIDIAEDAKLTEAYGIRIPVVRHRESGGEAGWPFVYADLVRLLSSD